MNKGFSLLELIIVLFITIILLFIGVSGWNNFKQQQNSHIIMQQIAGAINFARIEAIKRGEPIIFCKSSDHQHCGGEWRDGQLVISSQGEVLQALDPLPLGDNLIWRSSFGRNDALELLPTGFTNGQQGRFYYISSHKNTELAPVLVINQTGRIRLE